MIIWREKWVNLNKNENWKVYLCLCLGLVGLSLLLGMVICRGRILGVWLFLFYIVLDKC